MTDDGAQRGSNNIPLELSKSPLVRVLCQIRWPELAAFDAAAVSSDLGKLISSSYPLLSKDQEQGITVSPNGAVQTMSGQTFRYSSVDGSWRVGLGATFLAIETSKYSNHGEFLARLVDLVGSLLTVSSIPVYDRIGYRYTNRLSDVADLESLTDYFDPSVLGGLVLQNQTFSLMHSISESLFRVDDGAMLLVRSAWLKNGGTVDPTLPHVEGDSWVLDLDAFDETAYVSFSPESVSTRASQLAKVAYTHFAAAIKDPFIERFK